jgi:xanthine/CO dehydrogenase XdhC/CoxF family maturation factor
VVAVRGSAQCARGDHFIVAPQHVDDGLLRVMSWRVREGGGLPVVVEYPASDPDARRGFGLAPNASALVLHERGSAARWDPLVFADRCIVSQRRGAMATVIASTDGLIPVGERVAITEDRPDVVASSDAVEEALTWTCADVLSGSAPADREVTTPRGKITAFVEVLEPPPRLFVFGGGPDVVPVVDFAHTLGWEVFVCTPHAQFHVRERFSKADHVLVASIDEAAGHVADSVTPLAVVMNQEYDDDKRALAALVRSRACYIGVHAARCRTRTMLAEIGRGADDERVSVPAGITIGARTPAERALAILAEAQAHVAQVRRHKRLFSGVMGAVSPSRPGVDETSREAALEPA